MLKIASCKSENYGTYHYISPAVFSIADLKKISWCNVIQQIKKVSPNHPPEDLHAYTVYTPIGEKGYLEGEPAVYTFK